MWGFDWQTVLKSRMRGPPGSGSGNQSGAVNDGGSSSSSRDVGMGPNSIRINL